MSHVRLLAFICLVLSSINCCFARTAFAWVESVHNKSSGVGYAKTQNEADRLALQGCKEELRKAGLAHLAKGCRIAIRGEQPGYGALVFDADASSFGIATGYPTVQAAADAAYASCSKRSKTCQEKDILNWPDFEGFPPQKVAKSVETSSDCRPQTNTLRCRSNCRNGDCVVSYENGCKIRVRVNPVFDGFQNQWTYPSPPC